MSKQTKIVLLFLIGILAAFIFYFLKEGLEDSVLTDEYKINRSSLFLVLIYFIYLFLLLTAVLSPLLGTCMIFFKDAKWFKKLMQ